MQRGLLLLAEAVTRAPREHILLVLSDLKRKRKREEGRKGGREEGREGRGKKRRGQADVKYAHIHRH